MKTFILLSVLLATPNESVVKINNGSGCAYQHTGKKTFIITDDSNVNSSQVTIVTPQGRFPAYLFKRHCNNITILVSDYYLPITPISTELNDGIVFNISHDGCYQHISQGSPLTIRGDPGSPIFQNNQLVGLIIKGLPYYFAKESNQNNHNNQQYKRFKDPYKPSPPDVPPPPKIEVPDSPGNVIPDFPEKKPPGGVIPNYPEPSTPIPETLKGKIFHFLFTKGLMALLGLLGISNPITGGLVGGSLLTGLAGWLLSRFGKKLFSKFFRKRGPIPQLPGREIGPLYEQLQLAKREGRDPLLDQAFGMFFQDEVDKCPDEKKECYQELYRKVLERVNASAPLNVK